MNNDMRRQVEMLSVEICALVKIINIPLYLRSNDVDISKHFLHYIILFDMDNT